MIAKNEHIERRQRLMEVMTGDCGSICLLGSTAPRRNGDGHYPFKQDSFVYYLTGLAMSDIAIILHDGKATLFVRPHTIDHEVWEGPGATFEELKDRTGVDDVRDRSELDEVLSSIERVCSLRDLAPVGADVCEELRNALIDLRLRKSDAEIAEIERSLDVTAEAYRQMMAATRAGITGLQLQAMLDRVYREAGAIYAFSPIISQTGAVLHGATDTGPLEDGRLVLCDSGAELEYTSDITRTWPVSGSFTDEQLHIYETVRRAKDEATAACRPGTTYLDLHIQAERTLANGLLDAGVLKGDLDAILDNGAHRLFFPHGLGHALGLDVHDMGEYPDPVGGYSKDHPRSDAFGRKFLRFARPLQERYVVTVEPGIYFIAALLENEQFYGPHEAFINLDLARELVTRVSGIRLEDDVLVETDGGRTLGPGIPITPDDVSAAVGA